MYTTEIPYWYLLDTNPNRHHSVAEWDKCGVFRFRIDCDQLSVVVPTWGASVVPVQRGGDNPVTGSSVRSVFAPGTWWRHFSRRRCKNWRRRICRQCYHKVQLAIWMRKSELSVSPVSSSRCSTCALLTTYNSQTVWTNYSITRDRQDSFNEVLIRTVGRVGMTAAVKIN
jgi:hypothetical protein